MNAAIRPERRANPRFPVAIGCVGVSIAGRDTDTSGHAYDLSATGARMELDDPPQPGDTVDLAVHLPCQQEPVRVRATVMWALADPDDPRGARLGTRFDAFADSADRRRLLRYLEDAAWRPAA